MFFQWEEPWQQIANFKQFILLKSWLTSVPISNYNQDVNQNQTAVTILHTFKCIFVSLKIPKTQMYAIKLDICGFGGCGFKNLSQ